MPVAGAHLPGDCLVGWLGVFCGDGDGVVGDVVVEALEVPAHPAPSQRFRDLYRRRVSVERAFGDLKHGYGLAPLRVRGLAKVQLHADLVMLARLGQALSRARAVPLAA